MNNFHLRFGCLRLWTHHFFFFSPKLSVFFFPSRFLPRTTCPQRSSAPIYTCPYDVRFGTHARRLGARNPFRLAISLQFSRNVYIVLQFVQRGTIIAPYIVLRFFRESRISSCIPSLPVDDEPRCTRWRDVFFFSLKFCETNCLPPPSTELWNFVCSPT